MSYSCINIHFQYQKPKTYEPTLIIDVKKGIVKRLNLLKIKAQLRSKIPFGKEIQENGNSASSWRISKGQQGGKEREIEGRFEIFFRFLFWVLLSMNERTKENDKFWWRLIVVGGNGMNYLLLHWILIPIFVVWLWPTTNGSKFENFSQKNRNEIFQLYVTPNFWFDFVYV